MLENKLAVLVKIEYGLRIEVDSLFTKDLSALLEVLFHANAYSAHGSSCLLADIEETEGRLTFGKKIVDDKDSVIFGDKIRAYGYVIDCTFCERSDF